MECWRGVRSIAAIAAVSVLLTQPAAAQSTKPLTATTNTLQINLSADGNAATGAGKLTAQTSLFTIDLASGAPAPKSSLAAQTGTLAIDLTGGAAAATTSALKFTAATLTINLAGDATPAASARSLAYTAATLTMNLATTAAPASATKQTFRTAELTVNLAQ